MPLPLLREIVTIFGLAIAVVFLCNRLKIPTIIGFLFTGVAAGPYGLRLVDSADKVDLLAQIGVVLLLFSIGVQFSFKELLQIKKVAILGGSLQMALTSVVSFIALILAGVRAPLAIFLSLIISQSSTTIMLRVFQNRAEAESPHGRAALGMSILQDIATVPIMLFTPLLAGASNDTGGGSAWVIIKAGFLVVAIVIAANYLVPKALYQINRTRDRELFMFSILFIGLAIAWLTSHFGLSLALGAFIAGLIISESEYSHQTLASIMPFRDVFSSFFFVSVGMLFDVGFFLHHPAAVLALALVVMAGKAIIAALSVAILRYPLRTSILAGIALGELGEFAFVLSRAGLGFGILKLDAYQMFLGVSIVTMILAPFFIAAGPRIAAMALALPLPVWIAGRHHAYEEHAAKEHLRDHLVIVGFGVNGRNLAHAAVGAGIPYIITELNPDTVRSERAKGQPIHFADATQEAVLEWVGIHTAKVLVVAVSDTPATRRIVEATRRLNPRIYVIARTRYVQEMKALYDLGADDVVPEDFETSVEIFSRVLTRYLIPQDEIERFISEVRSDGYKMFRSMAKEASSMSCVSIPDLEIASLKVPSAPHCSGKSLSEFDLRRKYGVTVVAIRRDSGIVSNPHGGVVVEGGDVLFILGKPDEIRAIAPFFSQAPPAQV